MLASKLRKTVFEEEKKCTYWKGNKAFIKLINSWATRSKLRKIVFEEKNMYILKGK